jgi:hypothetical protein
MRGSVNCSHRISSRKRPPRSSTPTPNVAGEDPAVSRARNTLTEGDRKLAKHLDGLEAGIPADVIAARIAATQREKSAAESVLATAPPAPAPLTLEEVMGTLTELRDLPELLGRIAQADRDALYQALGLTVRYRRIGSTEEVKLISTLRGVDLERVGAKEGSKNSRSTGYRAWTWNVSEDRLATEVHQSTVEGGRPALVPLDNFQWFYYE